VPLLRPGIFEHLPPSSRRSSADIQNLEAIHRKVAW